MGSDGAGRWVDPRCEVTIGTSNWRCVSAEVQAQHVRSFAPIQIAICNLPWNPQDERSSEGDERDK